jgi:hypothetical protein
VKCSGDLNNRVSSIIRRYKEHKKFVAYMAFSFIKFFHVLVVPFYHCIYGFFQEECSKWGLIINITKTKYMSLGTDTNYLEVDNGDVITGCAEYKYLGPIFAKDGRDTKYTP